MPGYQQPLKEITFPEIILWKEGDKATARVAARTAGVTDTRADADRLLAELQAEVKARSTILEHLTARIEEAEQRAEDAGRRAALNEEQAQAVDTYLNRTLENRLTRLERSARRREWLIGTVIALIVGIAAILVTRFAYGF